MIEFLRKNLAWMILAFILSTALWLLVTFQQNPDESSVFRAIPVEVHSVPPGYTLRVDIAPIDVVVVAPRDVLQELRPNRIQATIDASQASAGLQELLVDVRVLDGRARVESAPARTLVHLEPTRTKQVPVRVSIQGQVPTGYSARQEPRVTPGQVNVTGPESFVNQVSAVVTDVSLEGVRTDVNEVFRAVPQTAAGQAVSRVTVTPESVLVEITIEQQLAYKTVPLAAQVVGNPAFGYQIVGIFVDPSALTVSGEPKVLDTLEFLPTRPVDVSGADGDMALNVAPAWPPGVAPVRQQNLVVRIYVSPIEGSKTIEVASSVRNLAEGLQATFSPNSVPVTVAGPMPVLAGIRPQDVQVTIDGAGLTPGTHTVRPRIDLPPLVRALSAPERVTVTIK
jgi:YbbR domain-containing protein